MGSPSSYCTAGGYMHFMALSSLRAGARRLTQASGESGEDENGTVAIRPIVEDDVVPQEQRGRGTLAVDPVSHIVGASVVVDDGAVDLASGPMKMPSSVASWTTK